MILSTRPEFIVIGEAGSAAAALAIAADQQPDVVLLDVDLGADDGLVLLPRLLASTPKSRVIVLTGSREASVHQEALSRGARGLVLKDKAPMVLLKAIEKVRQGELWFERTLLTQLIDRVAAPESPSPDSDAGRIASLTSREREIIALLGQGLRNQEIADALFINDKTVRNHLTAIFSKLGVSDRFELALFAYRHGLARIPL